MNYKGFEDGQPVIWLRKQFLAAKDIPQPVKDHILRLFKKLPRYQDRDVAQLESQRMMCYIHHARAQYALLNMAPSDRRFLPLSKSAATWFSLLAKCRRTKSNGDGSVKPKRKVPSTATSRSPDDEHAPESDDAETA